MPRSDRMRNAACICGVLANGDVVGTLVSREEGGGGGGRCCVAKGDQVRWQSAGPRGDGASRALAAGVER